MRRATPRLTSPNDLGRLLLAAAVLLAIGSPAVAEDTSQASDLRYVSPAIVKAWQEDGTRITFLDVREPDEFTAGHLPQAINIVYTQVASLAEQLPRESPIVLYCIHSAHRAPEAARTLHRLGFTNAYVLEGGIAAWHAGGLTIRASDLAKAPTILPLTERCEHKVPPSSDHTN